MMTKLRKPEFGLSVIETFVVVILVGVVVTFGLNSFMQISRNKRDSQRQADIKSFHLRLESFFARTAYYPTLKNLNDTSWVSKNMKDLTTEEMQDPKGTSAALAEKPTANIYSYQPTAADDMACDNVKKACVKYVLSAKLENSKTIFSRSHLN